MSLTMKTLKSVTSLQKSHSLQSQLPTVSSRPNTCKAKSTNTHASSQVTVTPYLSNGSHPCLRHTDRATSHQCRSTTNADGSILSDDDIVRVVSMGDLVSLHYTCRGEDGEVLESSRDDLEEGPVCFEVGAGDIVGNVLFTGFDEAVRGLAVGQTTLLDAEGGPWKPDLLFSVPEDHPEITRLQGRYKNQGGLKDGMIIELANGGIAAVVSMTGGVIKIDANNMLAGKTLTFELEVVKIEKSV